MLLLLWNKLAVDLGVKVAGSDAHRVVITFVEATHEVDVLGVD